MSNYKYVVYDVKLNKVTLCTNSKEVNDITNCGVNYISQSITNNSLISERFIIYNYGDLHYFRKNRNCIEKYNIDVIKSKIPNYLIKKEIKKYKDKYYTNIIKSLKKNYPGELKSKPIYIFNDNLEVIKVLYSYEEVANELNIKKGTVKSRLSRIKDKDAISRFKMCNYKTYKEVFNN